MPFQGFGKKIEEKEIITQHKLKSLMIMAARWGTFVSHQAYMQRDLHRLANGLFRKNYPNEHIPKNLAMDLNKYVDKETGKTFAQISHQTVIEDWANSISTHDSSKMISEFEDTNNPAEVLDMIGEQTEELRNEFNKYYAEVEIAKEGHLENLHLN